MLKVEGIHVAIQSVAVLRGLLDVPEDVKLYRVCLNTSVLDSRVEIILTGPRLAKCFRISSDGVLLTAASPVIRQEIVELPGGGTRTIRSVDWADFMEAPSASAELPKPATP